MKWLRFCSLTCCLLLLWPILSCRISASDITGNGSGGDCALSLSWNPYDPSTGQNSSEAQHFAVAEGYLPFGPTSGYPLWHFSGGAFEITGIPRDGRPLDLYCSFSIGFVGTGKTLVVQLIGALEGNSDWEFRSGFTNSSPIGNSSDSLGTMLIFHAHTDSFTDDSTLPAFFPSSSMVTVLRGNPLTDVGNLRISNVLYHSSRGTSDSTSALLNQMIEVNQSLNTIEGFLGYGLVPSSSNNVLYKLTSIYQRVNAISNILPGFHSLFSSLGDIFSYDKLVRAAEDNSLTITPSTGNFWHAVVDLLSSFNADAAQKAVYEERAQEAGALDVLDSAYDAASGGGFFSTLGSMFGIFSIVDWDSTNVENGATSYGYDWFSYRTKEDLIFTPLKKGPNSDPAPNFWDLQMQEIRELGMDGGDKR